jgi:hypothetical protein
MRRQHHQKLISWRHRALSEGRKPTSPSLRELILKKSDEEKIRIYNEFCFVFLDGDIKECVSFHEDHAPRIITEGN